jgi:hypothetical protein
LCIIFTKEFYEAFVKRDGEIINSKIIYKTIPFEKIAKVSFYRTVI